LQLLGPMNRLRGSNDYIVDWGHSPWRGNSTSPGLAAGSGLTSAEGVRRLLGGLRYAAATDDGDLKALRGGACHPARRHDRRRGKSPRPRWREWRRQVNLDQALFRRRP